MVLPLSAMYSNSLSTPSTVRAAVGKIALTVPLPAPIIWHIRHQHARTVVGASVIR
jgi:hypothetical protein